MHISGKRNSLGVNIAQPPLGHQKKIKIANYVAEGLIFFVIKRSARDTRQAARMSCADLDSVILKFP